jgi:hypothetical protein
MATSEQRTSRGPVRRVLRAVRKLLVIVLLLAVVATVATLVIVHTGWGRGLIKDQIETALRSSFPGGATIGALEGSVLGDFTLKDLVIRDLEGKPAITVGTLRANVALGKLMRRTAEIETLELEDVTIVMGKAPLVAPDEDDEPSDPTSWSVQLPSIDVRRGSFEYSPGGTQPIGIEGITIQGKLAIPTGGAISAKDLMVTGTWRERKLPIVISGGVEVDAGVEIPAARLKLGELSVDITSLAIDTQQPHGTIRIVGSPAAIAAVVPEVELPAGVDVEIVTKPSGRAADVSIAGKLGDAKLHGAFHADLERETVAGWFGAGDLSLRRLLRSSGTRPPIRLRGELALAVTLDRKGVRGIAGVRGAARDLPETHATIVIDATWREAALTVLASGAGDSRVAVAGHATMEQDKLVLDRGRIVAFVKDLGAATGKLVEASGRELRVDAKLDQPATLTPALDLAFSGSVRGQRVVYDDLRIANVDTTFEGTMRDKLLVQSTTRVAGAYQAGSALGSATIGANLLADGRIYARVDAKPAAAAVGVKANGYVTVGDRVEIALGDHELRPAVGAPWIGKGGTIEIDSAADSITVRQVVTTNGSGKAKLEASVIAGTLEAAVDATGLPVSAIDPAYRGTVSGKLAVKRRGTRWDGGGDLVAAGLVIDPEMPVFDGNVKVGVAGRKVTLDAHAKSAGIGGVRFELDVEGPRDLTDAMAWKRLDRTAIQTAVITVDKVRLDTVSSTGGAVEGKLVVGGTEVSGSLDVKGVTTPLGLAEGTVSFSPIGKDLFASWNAMLSDVGEASIGLRVAFPQRPFDPVAWKQLGRGIVQSLTASFDDIAVDPVKLAKLGIDAPYSGRADIRLAVGAAATAATLDIDLRTIEGGVLKKPIDIHLEATTDAAGTVASACVSRAKDPRGDACARSGLSAAVATVPRLLEIKDVKVPVTMATWLTSPQTALGATLAGTIAIPIQSAPEYLALVGREGFDPKRGTVGGTITIAGTVGRPTGTGKLTLESMQLLSEIAGRSIPELSKLEIDGSWDGTLAKVSLTAKEATRDKRTGTVNAKVIARPQKIEEGTATFTAVEFDLAPLAAFLPGELAASQGILAATITVNGFDLATSRIRGDLHITKGHVPLHPIVGTLRDATMHVLMSNAGINLKARGLLNSCRNPDNPRCTENITLVADSPPDVSKLDATLIATKVSTLGEIEPIIDGTAKVGLRRTGRDWSGDIFLRKGRVAVPVSTGDDLLDFESPDDVYFTDNPPKQIRFGEAKVPTKPWLDARVFVESTQIDVEEYGVKGAVATRSPLRLLIGDAVGLDGKIWIEYGTAADIFGRSYEIEQNDIVSFNDGTIEPTVNLQMSHAFPDMLLIMKVQGRPSDADFPALKFEADPPGNHSEGELFGFFLGGDPGGSVSAQTGDAAKGAGVSVLSQALAKRLQAVLPKRLRVDVLQCLPGTSTQGGSCTIGRRLLEGRLYIALKKRLTPSINENAEEALLQYYLSTEWFVEGTGGTANIIGADLLWRRRW